VLRSTKLPVPGAGNGNGGSVAGRSWAHDEFPEDDRIDVHGEEAVADQAGAVEDAGDELAVARELETEEPS